MPQPDDIKTANSKGNKSPAGNDAKPQSPDAGYDPNVLSAMKTAIGMSEFGQYLGNNIPYSGYVFGVGKVNYWPVNNPVVLIPEADSNRPSPLKPQPHPAPLTGAQGDPWFWAGANFGLSSMLISSAAWLKCNNLFWISAKGEVKSANLLAINEETNTFINGVQGYRNSYKLAGKEAAELLKFSNKIAYVGVIIPAFHTAYVGEINTENTVDFAFACLGFVPGAGWVICGLYTVADIVSVSVTNKKLATHAKEGIVQRWEEFNEGLNVLLNTFFNHINAEINRALPSNAKNEEYSHK